MRSFLSRVMVFLYIFSFFVFIWPWYMSIDARYLRDNYQYISERYATAFESGKAVNTHGIHMIMYPEPIALACLYMAEQDWTTTYLSYYTQEKQYIENPQDAFSRLQLQANSPYIQTVYDSIMWDLIVLQDGDNIKDIIGQEAVENESIAHAWLSERPVYQKGAQNAIKNMLDEFMICWVVFLIMTPFTIAAVLYLISISGIFKHIIKDKRKVLDGGRNK